MEPLAAHTSLPGTRPLDGINYSREHVKPLLINSLNIAEQLHLFYVWCNTVAKFLEIELRSMTIKKENNALNSTG